MSKWFNPIKGFVVIRSLDGSVYPDNGVGFSAQMDCDLVRGNVPQVNAAAEETVTSVQVSSGSCSVCEQSVLHRIIISCDAEMCPCFSLSSTPGCIIPPALPSTSSWKMGRLHEPKD